MTNQQKPEALHHTKYLTAVYRDINPGDEALDLIMHPKMTAASWSHVINERDRLQAENETLRVERERNLNSIRVNNEIINKKNAELESLTTGYAADRLEIESLQARIKTMAEEHADELTVAHLDGRMRAAQPAGAQQPAPSAAVASKAVLAAIRAANMQLVRTGDDEFMLVTLKQATPQADSQPAPDEATAMSRTGDLAEAGRWPSDWVEAYRRGYSDRAARAPADSVTAPAGGANWQDISTAPKDGTRFVAVGQNYGLDSEKQHTCIAQWLAGCWVEVSDWNGASKLKYLTHWMPLPPLPGSAARAPADSVTAPVNEAVAYLDIGAGGYIDLGTDLSEEALSRLPKGRHALTIAGTYGIDGYTPTTSADSVLEDAARESEYRRGYRHGYEQRDAEVRGALA